MRPTAQLLHTASSTLSIGQQLSGKAGSYKVLDKLQKERDMWTAMLATTYFTGRLHDLT